MATLGGDLIRLLARTGLELGGNVGVGFLNNYFQEAAKEKLAGMNESLNAARYEQDPAKQQEMLQQLTQNYPRLKLPMIAEQGFAPAGETPTVENLGQRKGLTYPEQTYTPATVNRFAIAPPTKLEEMAAAEVYQKGVSPMAALLAQKRKPTEPGVLFDPVSKSFMQAPVAGPLKVVTPPPPPITYEQKDTGARVTLSPTEAPPPGYYKLGTQPIKRNTAIKEMAEPGNPSGPPVLMLVDEDTGEPIKKVGDKGGLITPDAADLFARIGLQDLKQLPAMGFGPQMRGPVFKRMAEIVKNEGIIPEDMAVRQTVRQEMRKGMGQLERQRAQIEPFIATFDKNIEVLEGIFKSPTGVPVVNKWIQAGKRAITGDPELAKIDVAIKTVANEFARIMTSATAGGTQMPESEIKKVEGLLNAAQTPEQVKAALDIMKRDTQNRKASFKEQEDLYKNRLEQLGNYKAPATASPAPAVPAVAPTGPKPISQMTTKEIKAELARQKGQQ